MAMGPWLWQEPAEAPGSTAAPMETHGGDGDGGHGLEGGSTGKSGKEEARQRVGVTFIGFV